MSQVAVIIDGKEVKAEKGTTLLQAAREAGIDIPALCHHEGLAPYGACRLCIVAITAPRSSIVASCGYLVEEGLVVETHNPEVVAARRLTLEFLLSRYPQSGVIRELAAREGVNHSRFGSPESECSDELCILCGLCVRVCREAIGAAALCFVGRGIERRVSTPFDMHSEDCIGCGACAEICPTGAIKIEDRGDKRILHTWNTTVELHSCPDCGSFFAPGPTFFLKDSLPEIADMWTVCPECRRNRTARQWIERSHFNPI